MYNKLIQCSSCRIPDSALTCPERVQMLQSTSFLHDCWIFTDCSLGSYGGSGSGLGRSPLAYTHTLTFITAAGSGVQIVYWPHVQNKNSFPKFAKTGYVPKDKHYRTSVNDNEPNIGTYAIRLICIFIQRCNTAKKFRISLICIVAD